MEKKLKINDLLDKGDIAKQLAGLSFEAGLELLEELVNKVETGQLPLEQALLAYERGSQILAHLKGLISGVEEKLKVIERDSKSIASKQ